MYNTVYSPEEDSFLLLDCAKKYVKSLNKKGLRVCEVGVGSGYVLSELVKEFEDITFDCYGVDINEDALAWTRFRFEEIDKEVTLVQSDLFSDVAHTFVSKKFDLILFNTPYLPCEGGEKLEDLEMKDRAIYGGKKGYETIVRFVQQLNDYLDNEGVCLMLFSSLSKPHVIDEWLVKQLMYHKKIGSKGSLMEEMLCYKIWKKDALKDVSLIEGLHDMKYFSAGKHSKIMKGLYDIEDGKGMREVIVKIAEPIHVKREVLYLEKLSALDFVPTIFANSEHCVVMEFIEGQRIEEFWEFASKEEIEELLNLCLKACYELDKSGINKYEMNHPYKHVLVLKNDGNMSVKFIDFERCYFSDDPKNLRQFLQYIRRNSEFFETKGMYFDFETIREMSESYSVDTLEEPLFGVKKLYK